MANTALARLNSQLMTDEVKVDLERPHAVRDRRSRESSGRNVKRHVPRVINPRTLGEANLSDDLGPQM
jgi:hypothetical protein